MSSFCSTASAHSELYSVGFCKCVAIENQFVASCRAFGSDKGGGTSLDDVESAKLVETIKLQDESPKKNATLVTATMVLIDQLDQLYECVSESRSGISS